MRLVRIAALVLVAAGCSVPTATLVDGSIDATISVNVTGVSGRGLVLENNGVDDLVVDGSGQFAFAQTVRTGDTYNITVKSQPTSPSQTCTVNEGSGTVGGANITVAVSCLTDQFKISGTITGLAGSGLVLQNNGGDDLPVTADGTFTFPSTVGSGQLYLVTVKTQPSTPSQTCSVVGGLGTVVASDITNITITCKTGVFTIGGSVSGLVGTGLVLQNNGGDDLAISKNGAFTFVTPVTSGQNYAVTVRVQPNSPSQTCTVSAGTGVVGGSAVTNVSVICTTQSFTIGGTVTGLVGSGLLLRNNGADDLAVTTSGTFTFVTPIASGATYAVTVATQPGTPTQTCTVSGGSGTVGSSNVTSVAITCSTNTYTIGGTVTGLSGSGLILRDNGGDDLPITASGTFTFVTAVASNATYSVTVASSPTAPTQTCTVTNGSGTVVASNITNVAINCTTNSYTVGGTVSGLTGSGLVLQDNLGDNLSITGNGTFTFATSVLSGHTYSVTVLTQPSSPTQTCNLSAATGTVAGANITTVVVSCAVNQFTIGGTINGLSGSGLVLQDNGGDDLAIAGGATTFAFATPLATGATYAVTVKTQPTGPAQTCTVAAGTGSGTVGNANITTVTINCTTNTYNVGGTVTGLAAGSTVTLQDNGADNLTVNANGSFTFATKLASGTTYLATVFSQPSSPAQTCNVTSGSGTITNAAITSIVVTCTTNKYTIGGTVSGLVGTGLILKDNGGDPLTISANGNFTFATSVASGATYSVTVGTAPSNPAQNCTVTSGSGTVAAANITNVAVSCTTNTYTIGGTVNGLQLVGTGGVHLQIQDLINGTTTDNLTITASGTFTFATHVASGGVYAVSVLAQPTKPWQTCTVTSGSGTVTSANVTSIVVTCTVNTYTIGGTVGGADPYSFVVQNNGGDNLTVAANATTFTFATRVASGATYDVSVLNHPLGTFCKIGFPTGTVAGANVVVQMTCNPANIAFVTSTTYVPGAWGAGALAAADNACQTRANAAMLPGTYKAWMSTSTVNASSRLVFNTTTARGWMRRDGKPFADTITSLTSGTVWYPLALDENGMPAPSSQVATGTKNNGTYSGANCNDYTSQTGSVTIGAPIGGTDAWTASSAASCANAIPIYCFGVNQTTPVAVAPPPTRLAFISSTLFDPSTGQAGANLICSNDSMSFFLPTPGNYAAYLNTSTSNAISNFSTFDLPWARPDGVLLAPTAAALGDVQNNWLAMPDQFGDGNYYGLSPNAGAFYGRSGTGLFPATSMCNDWTTSAATSSGVYSTASEPNYGSQACNVQLPVLCLQISTTVCDPGVCSKLPPGGI